MANERCKGPQPVAAPQKEAAAIAAGRQQSGISDLKRQTQA